MQNKSIIWTILLLLLISCVATTILNTEQCCMCADISRHAPSIINLSTGEQLVLDVYEPHPFRSEEIAEDQPCSYFNHIQGAGAKGCRVGGEFVLVTIPIKSEKMNHRYCCNSCIDRLAKAEESGYILVDLINPQEPVVYPVSPASSFYIRNYSVSIQEVTHNNRYAITVTGHYT